MPERKIPVVPDTWENSMPFREKGDQIRSCLKIARFSRV